MATFDEIWEESQEYLALGVGVLPHDIYVDSVGPLEIVLTLENTGPSAGHQKWLWRVGRIRCFGQRGQGGDYFEVECVFDNKLDFRHTHNKVIDRCHERLALAGLDQIWAGKMQRDDDLPPVKPNGFRWL